MTNELFHFGNGRFIALMQKLSIKEIRAEHTSKSFCSLEFINTDSSSFTKSQRIYGSSRWHTRLLRLKEEDNNDTSISYSAEIDDALIDPSDLFIRSFKNSEPLRYRLILPEYAHLSDAPGVSYKTRHCRSIWIRIKHSNYEEILQITFCGLCQFDSSEGVINIEPGNSALIFSMGTIPAPIHKNAARALHLMTENKLSDPPIPFKEELVGRMRNSVYALSLMQRGIEGPVSGSDDPYIRALPMYCLVRLYKAMGMNSYAKKISTNGINSFLSVRDCVALGKGREPQYATDIFSLTPSLLMLTATEEPNQELLKKMLPFLLARLKLQTKALIKGMLPFEGREYYYNQFCTATDGSAISTLFYIKATALVSENHNDTEITEGYNNAREKFRENFISDGKIYLNAPQRSNVSRFPAFIYGKCQFCDNKEFTWLMKNATGGYCCDKCMHENRNATVPSLNVRKESYLPVFWSLYLETEIFNENEIAYAQELAMSTIDTLPVTDIALLLLSTAYRAHPLQKEIFTKLIKKMNSLDIWYDEKGVFDTLTNALCCYSIIKTGLK